MSETPILIVGTYQPVIGINPLAVFPLDPEVDAAIDIPIEVNFDFVPPRPMTPQITAALNDENLTATRFIVPGLGGQNVVLTGANAKIAAQTLIEILADLSDSAAGGFKAERPNQNGGVEDVIPDYISGIETNFVTPLYSGLTSAQGLLFRDSTYSFMSSETSVPIYTVNGEQITEEGLKTKMNSLRTDFAEALHDAYFTQTDEAKVKLDNAVKAVFFDQKFLPNAGSVFNAAAVASNVLGLPDVGKESVSFDDNKLMTGLLFNRGNGQGNSSLPSDLMLAYNKMSQSVELLTDFADDREKQRRTFAALQQAIADFVAFRDQVTDMSTEGDASQDEKKTIAPGSAFTEPVRAALMRSACRVYALYDQLFTAEAAPLTCPLSNEFYALGAFNTGFKFKSGNTLVDWVYLNVPGGSSDTASGPLGPLANINTAWNFASDSVALRQIYYLRSTSARQDSQAGQTFVTVSVTATPGGFP